VTIHPEYRHIFRLRDGETIICAPYEAKRYIDRRTPNAPLQTVWEINTRGIIRVMWPEEILSWEQEELTKKTDRHEMRQK